MEPSLLRRCMAIERRFTKGGTNVFPVPYPIVLALLLSLVFAVPVCAGGWAVITLDELPTGVVAGEPFTIGFTVLQHGRTPMTDLEPTVTAKLSFDEELVVYAAPEGGLVITRRQSHSPSRVSGDGPFRHSPWISLCQC